jgi:hypothetical protein
MHLPRTLALLCVIALTTTARAQSSSQQADSSPSSPNPQSPRTARPFDGMTLNDAQRADVRLSTARAREARAAILRRQAQRGRLSAEDRAALSAIAETHNAFVRSLLTVSQRDLLAANLRADRERRRLAGQATQAHSSTKDSTP